MGIASGPSRHPKDALSVNEFCLGKYGLGALLAHENPQISAKFHVATAQN